MRTPKQSHSSTEVVKGELALGTRHDLTAMKKLGGSRIDIALLSCSDMVEQNGKKLVFHFTD